MQGHHVVIPVRIKDGSRRVDLDLVVVAVVARVSWLEHDLDGRGAAPQVGIRIVASKGGNRVTIGHHEPEVKVIVIPADAGRGRDRVARRYPAPVVCVDEWPQHGRCPPDRFVELAIDHGARGEARNPRRRATDGGIALDPLATPASRE